MSNASIKKPTNMVDIIRTNITAAMTVRDLSVINDSARHAGHAGAVDAARHGHAGQSHFIVTIVSDDFIGLSRIDRQRKIYRLLADYMPKPIHALNLTCRTTQEL